MRIFLARTGKPKEMLKEFETNTLNFLYLQEDETDYKIKTISYLINEIQNMKSTRPRDIYNMLSKNGKRRYNCIKNQLNYLVKFGW